MKRYRGYYITTTPDTDENTGGLFCQVYSDRSCDTEVDNFCVHEGEDFDKIAERNIDLMLAQMENKVYSAVRSKYGYDTEGDRLADFVMKLCETRGVA